MSQIISDRPYPGQVSFSLPVHKGPVTVLVNSVSAPIVYQDQDNVVLQNPVTTGDIVDITYVGKGEIREPKDLPSGGVLGQILVKVSSQDYDYDWQTGEPSYTLPIATASTLGGVKKGTGVTIDASGFISANVTSVAGRTGAVSLSASDVSGLATVATTGSYNDLSDKPSSGAGTVTSVNASGGTTGLSFTGGPITTSGSLSLGGTLVVGSGGTGATDAPGARTNLGLVIGTDVQAQSTSLSNIAGLAGTSGLLKKTGANTWSLDTTSYLTSETDPVYTSSTWYSTTNNSANWNTAYSWGNHASAGYLLASTASSSYQPLDGDLTSIASLSGTSGLLKKTAANTWDLDTSTYLTTSTASSTYQPLDGDLTSIAGLSGTSGLLRKTAANTWSLDTNTYLTAEADTLATVTGRGSTTSTAVTFSGGATVGGTGVAYNGSTSGSTTLKAAATAGTTTITMPAATGTMALTSDLPTVNNGTLTLSIGSAAATNNTVTVGTGTGFSANTASNATYSLSVGPALTALASTMTGATTGFLKKTAADTYALDTSSYLTGNQTITFSGDASGSGTTAVTLTLATVNANVGTFNNVTVNAKGLVTGASNVSYVISGGALGTPSSGTLTSCTGLPVSTGVSGLGSGMATFLATPSSANLLATITDETGTGSMVFGTNPTITNPVLAGTVYVQQGAQTSKAAAATLTIAELLTGIIQYTGAAASLTMPTGTNIEGGVVAGLATDRAFEFVVINTGSGAATIATATGLTLVGSMSVTNGTSGQFRVRKTATNTYTVYRIS